MAIFPVSNIAIGAIAACVPTRVEKNRDYDHIIPAERELLVKTTGIEERRIAAPGQTASDLCFAAASQILDARGISAGEVGLLVFVTQSNDYYLPATAALLQQRLGLAKSTIAFDVGLGCSGYVYGLSIAASLMKTCGIKKALLLAGDISTATVSAEDKSAYPLFGDAGSATLLQHCEGGDPWWFNLMTDGSGADAIMIPDGYGRNMPSAASFAYEDFGPGIRRNRLQLALKGNDIFSFATREVPTSIHQLLEQSQVGMDEVDCFVMHQANKLMNETIRKKLGIAAEKTPYSLRQFANTSSASIPLTLVTHPPQASREAPIRLLLSGFGVGLSWGSVVMTTDGITCLPLIEV